MNCNIIYEISNFFSLKMSLKIWKYKNKLTKSISLHQNKIISVTWQIKATTFPYKPFDFLVFDFYFFLQRKNCKTWFFSVVRAVHEIISKIFGKRPKWDCGVQFFHLDPRFFLFIRIIQLNLRQIFFKNKVELTIEKEKNYNRINLEYPR